MPRANIPPFRRFAPLGLILSAFLASPLLADNWPQWRGPLGNGICTETGLPAEWGPEKNVAWRIELPGPAGSTPIIWNDRLFLTSVDGPNLVLMAFNTDGDELWKRTVTTGNERVRDDEGNYASPTPVTDGRYVWTLMGNGQLACYNFDGQEIWSFNVQDRYGPLKLQFGYTSTPVLHENRLFLQMIHGDRDPATREARVIALEKHTGAELWESSRVTGAYEENEHSYASPILYDDGETRCLITHGADYAVAYQLSDGTELWRCGGLNPQDDPDREYHPTLRFVASPAAASGIVVLPTAKNGPVFAVRPDLEGDLTGRDEAHHWVREQNTPDVPSPLIHEGLVYLCRENGNLIAMEADTGEEIYERRTHRHRHRASPVYADGKIYLTARDGKITVVKSGREFEILAENDMNEDMASSPAISNGTMYLRTFEALWAVREE